ncbi:hypothetical protein CPB83DRAFT_846505 [Crepidotus variabilis]|uniref:Uncharacterized protein n=1 Tax=Crepidotus variabilis TaxID=179855 RepID=A0A9P6EQJ7_9AGAR|nr:hypothetical protein CPB83DRAFT_846505 [Crepidotus variabilis]
MCKKDFTSLVIRHGDICVTKEVKVISSTMAFVAKKGGLEDLVFIPVGKETKTFEVSISSLDELRIPSMTALRGAFEDITQQFHNMTKVATTPTLSMGQAKHYQRRSSSITGDEPSYFTFREDTEVLLEVCQHVRLPHQILTSLQ